MARQPFNTRWAQGVESESSLNSFQAPGDVRVSTGWEGGQDKDAPPAGQENWWHNRVDSALQGFERNGVMGWHPQAIYGLGAPTYANDGNYYESLDGGNLGNNPVTTSGFWRFIGSTFFSGSDPGDIKTVAHNNAPSTGWLKCNGAVVLRSSYPRLFQQIGTTWNLGSETSIQFRLPDFRGEFLRGFDDGRGANPGRQFGSYEAGAVESHAHAARQALGLNSTSGSQGLVAFENTSVGSPLNTGAVGNYGGSETRPRNKTVNYWIKY